MTPKGGGSGAPEARAARDFAVEMTKAGARRGNATPAPFLTPDFPS
jgi:hypothetical protein